MTLLLFSDPDAGSRITEALFSFPHFFHCGFAASLPPLLSLIHGIMAKNRG
jgi:hypothetical protein